VRGWWRGAGFSGAHAWCLVSRAKRSLGPRDVQLAFLEWGWHGRGRAQHSTSATSVHEFSFFCAARSQNTQGCYMGVKVVTRVARGARTRCDTSNEKVDHSAWIVGHSSVDNEFEIHFSNSFFSRFEKPGSARDWPLDDVGFRWLRAHAAVALVGL